MPEPLSNIQQQWLAVAADLTLLEPAPLSTDTLLWLRSVDRNDTATWTKGLPLTVARFTEAAQQLIYERHNTLAAEMTAQAWEHIQNETQGAFADEIHHINRGLFGGDAPAVLVEAELKTLPNPSFACCMLIKAAAGKMFI
jgi:hypothetical protein